MLPYKTYADTIMIYITQVSASACVRKTWRSRHSDKVSWSANQRHQVCGKRWQ